MHAPRATLTTTAPPKERTRRAWVAPLAVVGALCVAGLAIGLGVGLSGHSSSSNNLAPIIVSQ
jgi:hypothetical protein